MSASGEFASSSDVWLGGDFEIVPRGAARAASRILAFHGMLLGPFVSSDNHYILAI